MTLSEMRTKIDTVIKELNATKESRKDQLIIAWQDPPTADDDDNALITFADQGVWDIEAHLLATDCPEQGTSGVLCLGAIFDHEAILPQHNTRRLYNILENCLSGVTLSLHPERPSRNRSVPEITITGVGTELAVESLTPAILDNSIGLLLTSANAVERIITGRANKDDDAWGRRLEK